eukprot:TRINITY_DN66406_c7_g1_i1.p2 TRINITY_DN66406_c7_g1~~TRINITY_DN66406_c7_g1_i1.p2  ORF type:complete len:505 (-),score=106.88 TRINITY_DN66406_c7_g1_i1:1761-3275(-)
MTTVSAAVASRKRTAAGQVCSVEHGDAEVVGAGHFNPAAPPHVETSQEQFPLKVYNTTVGTKTYFVGQFPTPVKIQADTDATLWKGKEGAGRRPKSTAGTRRRPTSFLYDHQKPLSPGNLIVKFKNNNGESGFTGKTESPTSKYCLLAIVDGTYWLLPAEYWYKFVPKVRTVAETAEEAEKLMDEKNRKGREQMKMYVKATETRETASYDYVSTTTLHPTTTTKGGTPAGGEQQQAEDNQAEQQDDDIDDLIDDEERSAKRRKRMEDDDVDDEMDSDVDEGRVHDDDDAESAVSDGGAKGEVYVDEEEPDDETLEEKLLKARMESKYSGDLTVEDEDLEAEGESSDDSDDDGQARPKQPGTEQSEDEQQQQPQQGVSASPLVPKDELKTELMKIKSEPEPKPAGRGRGRGGKTRGGKTASVDAAAVPDATQYQLAKLEDHLRKACKGKTQEQLTVNAIMKLMVKYKEYKQFGDQKVNWIWKSIQQVARNNNAIVNGGVDLTKFA